LPAACTNAVSAFFLQPTQLTLLFLDIRCHRYWEQTFYEPSEPAQSNFLLQPIASLQWKGLNWMMGYLLKPISFERFLKSVSKVLQMIFKVIQLPLLRRTPCRSSAIVFGISVPTGK